MPIYTFGPVDKDEKFIYYFYNLIKLHTIFPMNKTSPVLLI